MASMSTADLTTTAASSSAETALEVPKTQLGFSSKITPDTRCYDFQHLPTIEEFAALTSRVSSYDTYPLAKHIEKNVPIYNRANIDASTENSKLLEDEWYHVLLHRLGVLVIQGFFEDLTLLDDADLACVVVIAKEKAQSNGFAKGF